ncbi:MAG: hypothetical protein A3E87_04310 [Gammaproteobacteria bacterium RIFCSPHIGHO2_12_FULL_35_23]|nr:MAG: hypothetical protein A3E87_04310 [Gammaproteobacteria bacterium RIFCSPHIGHO2_12_FULL_35_23]
MENEIRLVLLIIGAIIILAILWDGLRRQRQERSHVQKDLASKMKAESQTVLREILQLDEKPLVSAYAANKMAYSASEKAFLKEELVVAETANFENEYDISVQEEVSAEVTEVAFLEEETSQPAETEPVMFAQEERLLTESPVSSNPPVAKATGGLSTAELSTFKEQTFASEFEEKKASSEAAITTPVSEPPKKQSQLIMFTIVAVSDKAFGGFSLLQALLNQGFKIGEDKIFHYYQEQEFPGRRLFSLAAATKTGVFELSNMASFSCRGLVLFMNSLDHGVDSAAIFGEMVEITEALAKDLKHAELRIGQSAPWDEAHLARLHKNLANTI